ncbi:MAG: HTTM domain-containing protein [Bacteroidetes bacterium]|nr:HTTM domain-containing protein [Bacteroidota bacterium]
MATKIKNIAPLARSATAPRPIAPLAVLRIAFGTIMFISTIRFILKGWIVPFYVEPKYHFTFYAFGWVHPLPAAGMYTVFAIMALASACIALGLYYRTAVLTYLITFVYVELLDKTYYLNHYYFVSIFTFLLLLVPANRYLSLDVKRNPALKATQVPAWTIQIFQAQLVLVYFFAGLSKLTVDWLIEAQPLRIWLPANTNLPLIGTLMDKAWVAYLFSWFGAIFDLTAGFFLLYRKTRPTAYFFVVAFHLMTAWLFKIGMFPFIMIAVTLVFFPFKNRPEASNLTWQPKPKKQKLLTYTLATYFILQLILPFRFLLYPGRLFWTEEGYRFSWRVMLMEKSGTCFFYIKDPVTGRKGEVDNHKFLTSFQERQMSTQPDMILQYAHYLKDVYQNKEVTVESYVTLNGSGSRLFIDSTIDLGRQPYNLSPKTWILPFKQ